MCELVGKEILERVRDLFTSATGVPIVFTDGDGEAITTVDEPMRFCGAMVHCEGKETLCLRRKKWDVPEPELESKLRDLHHAGEQVSHRCRGGFRDTAAPIAIDDEIVGYAVFARTVVEPPDKARFRRLAAEADMPEEVGEQVADMTLVRSQEEIEDVAEFLQIITALVARAAYDQLRARQVIELQEARDNLIHMIVHDLRTPLTSIMSGLQTIEGGDYDEELTREFVPMAIEGGQELLEMINTILDISKMESGQFDLDLSAMDFPAVAREALRQVEGLAEERDHELINSVSDDLPEVQADEDLIRRVVVNLLGNAVKFTSDGGRIEIGAEATDGALMFFVQDNGRGISEDDQEKIFEMFTGAEEENSTGLGLTFCQMVVESHGGEIWVDSELDEGSTFYVSLPPEPPQEEPDILEPQLPAREAELESDE